MEYEELIDEIAESIKIEILEMLEDPESGECGGMPTELIEDIVEDYTKDIVKAVEHKIRLAGGK